MTPPAPSPAFGFVRAGKEPALGSFCNLVEATKGGKGTKPPRGSWVLSPGPPVRHQHTQAGQCQRDITCQTPRGEEQTPRAPSLGAVPPLTPSKHRTTSASWPPAIKETPATPAPAPGWEIQHQSSPSRGCMKAEFAPRRVHFSPGFLSQYLPHQPRNEESV